MTLIQLLTNENQILISILAFIFSILEAILFYLLSSVILNINSTKKERNIFIIAMSIAGGISILLPNSIVRDSIALITFFVIIKKVFHQSIKNTFIAIIFSYLGILVSEYISESILINIFDITLYQILNIPVYYLLIIWTSFTIFYLSICIIKIIKNKDKKFLDVFHISLKTSVIINLILGIFTLTLETYLLSVYIDLVPFKLTLVIMVTLVLYFSISMYSIFRTNTLEKTRADLENEKMYNKTLSVLHDNIRGFKHDFNNIVQSIGGYVALKDMDGLEKYYQNLLNDCKITNNLNLLNPETINNPSIYSLLTNKYYTASEKNIKMTFSIFTDLSKINFNMYEFSRILGILLDNAIEAAEKTIEIEFTSDSKKQLFIIRNSCKDSNISMSKIFEKGYSTKNGNSGIGLWKVHKILSKNTNLDLFTSVKDNIFSQQLEVFY